MNNEELARWFEQNKQVLETAYLAGTLPRQQSGFGLHTPRSELDWEALRRPIAACIESAGTFLDIGCANGYLLECILRWTQERGFQMTAYGLDFSEKIIALAQARLPQYASHLFVGNAWDWEPPMTFDYVNTTLDYVPHELHEAFVNRLLERYLHPGGHLLVAEYLGKSANPLRLEIPVDQYLGQLGFGVASVRSASIDEFAMTRVAVIKNRQGNKTPRETSF
jgi:SAM-dependent methyltransferase